ncbi:MAG: hypothetical protein PF904_02320 [Kiritimatiellae bacterium]|jgi:hypothetical protein|nr:hypothetical protein [Kiritimatiellia bacterium]
MNKKISALILMSVISISIVSSVKAQDDNAGYSPFMLSIVDPIQVPPSDFYVGGLKLNLLYGRCHDFTGLDIGLFSYCTGNAEGALHIGGVTAIGGNGQGLMINLLANTVTGEYGGLQIGFLNNASHIDGLQIGVINIANTAYGLQIGVVNVIKNNDLPFFPIINGYF